MQSITKLAVATLLVVPLLQGCSDDSSKKDSADTSSDVGTGSETSDSTAAESSADSSEGSTGNDDNKATFRIPTTADIQASLGSDFEFFPLPGINPSATDCEYKDAKCEWQVPQAAIRDGIGIVDVQCNGNITISDSYIDNYVADQPELSKVTTLGVPAAIMKASDASISLVELTFVAKTTAPGAPLSLCEFFAKPQWDDSTGANRTLDVDAAADDLIALAKKLMA